MGKAENCEDAWQEDSKQLKILLTFKVKEVRVSESACTLNRSLISYCDLKVKTL